MSILCSGFNRILRPLDFMPVFNEGTSEYWRHVSNQDELPLAGELSSSGVKVLNNFLTDLGKESLDDSLENQIKGYILNHPDVVDHLRKLVGVTNKRMYLDLSYRFREKKYPGKDEGICGCRDDEFIAHQTSFLKNRLDKEDSTLKKLSAETMAEYFIDKGLLEVLESFQKLEKSDVESIIQKVVMPHDLQQEEAKRRGHGLEGKLAQFLAKFDIELLPQDKARNPMSQDIRLNKTDYSVAGRSTDGTHSYDLIIKKNDSIVAGILALVHSSDPGEFGVGKTGRTEDYQARINRYNEENGEEMELWALVDGCGFGENKGTLDSILDNVDGFVQQKTFYKIAVELHNRDIIDLKGIKFDSDYYTEEELEGLENWAENRDIMIKEEPSSNLTEIDGGRAYLYT